jgi:hypothetical protein
LARDLTEPSSLYRRLFLEALDAAFRAGELGFHASLAELAEPARFAQLLDAARGVSWVVYAKPPFGGPEPVFEYLGRYTHRVALSNSRLVRIADGSVAFRWKDYRHHDRQKVMTLEADEFLRRFLLPVLPDGFQRIRHYGLLGNRGRATKLALCRRLLAAPPPPMPVLADLTDPRDRYEALTGRSLHLCPVCHAPFSDIADEQNFQYNYLREKPAQASPAGGRCTALWGRGTCVGEGRDHG